MIRVHGFAGATLRLLVAASLVAASGAFAQTRPADPAKGQQIATTVCAACHGADGNSGVPANPKLAGQHPEYLYKQLRNFKPNAGGEAERPNAVMAAFAAQLSDDAMRDVAAFYASQKLKPSAARDASVVELGQRIYRGGIATKQIPACAGCHGPNGAGIPSLYPMLAGQFAEYTQSQLVAFRQHLRKNSAPMIAIASRMSDDEIRAISEYVAGLR